MAAPLAIPLLGKIGALLAGGGKAAATAGAAKGMAGTKLLGAIKSGLFGGMTKGQIATRLAPDALFGAYAGVMTPGDLSDKLIAGTTQAVGGGLGGLATGRMAGALGAGEGIQTLADLGGSFAGDFGGMAVGDALQRGKDKIMGGKGQTAFERMGDEQQRNFAQQVQNETLASLGINSGYMPGVRDQYLAELGLG
tara:strand:- start:1192 stop:1776 length:585 start_codon:yes stop_codon:yes gene_type:complete